MVHVVFSYGTLRQPEVQRALYGREVPTVDDALPGWRLDWVAITDSDVIRTSGSDRHPILRRTPDTDAGDAADAVSGARLELDDAGLAATDRYEVGDYVRIEATLASGVIAWVYVAAADA
jgi:gamma-glutamylcyclotransferase (GGCT)/AIG2-like uncharacterized protein YtfP